jgi:hypothetical protein
LSWKRRAANQSLPVTGLVPQFVAESGSRALIQRLDCMGQMNVDHLKALADVGERAHFSFDSVVSAAEIFEAGAMPCEILRVHDFPGAEIRA